jgi:hypothetical protein
MDHRQKRLLRRKNQRRCVTSRKEAVDGVLDLTHILLQQNLFAFEILKRAARGPYMKGRTSGRFFNASGQVRYLQPLRRTISEGMDQAHAFFRQREQEGIMRGRHGADQRRQMKAIRDFGEWLWRIGRRNVRSVADVASTASPLDR